MNPSRRGLGTGAKVGAVLAVIVIVVGALYLLPMLSSSSPKGPVTNVGANGPSGVYPLIQDFSKMTITVDTNDVPDQYAQNQTLAYTVLGKGAIGSTQYTKVEFVTVGQEADVVCWYNSSGGLGEVQLLGEGGRNYTGNALATLPFISTYTVDFSVFDKITNNATLFSELVPSTATTTTIGPTKAYVATYLLSAPTAVYSNIIVKYATFSGTNLRLAVYVYEKAPDKSSQTLEITSLTS